MSSARQPAHVPDPAASPVVAAYSAGPMGPAVLEAAAGEARLRRAPLVIVRVARGTSAVDDGLAGLTNLQAWADDARIGGLEVSISTVDAEGSVGSAIVDTAGRRDAGLLVIGVPRRSPVGKLIMGSTAQAVLLDAPCPVLTVRAR